MERMQTPEADGRKEVTNVKTNGPPTTWGRQVSGSSSHSHLERIHELRPKVSLPTIPSSQGPGTPRESDVRSSNADRTSFNSDRTSSVSGIGNSGEAIVEPQRAKSSYRHSLKSWSSQHLGMLQVPFRGFRRKEALPAGFIRPESAPAVKLTPRGRLEDLLESSTADRFIAVLVLVQLMVLCIEADARADYPGVGPRDMPLYAKVTNHVIYLFFCLEALCRMFVQGKSFFHTQVNLLDFLVIVGGFVEYLITFLGLETQAKTGFSLVRILRLSRLLRIIRSVRAISQMQELGQLVKMMRNCLRTVFWSFVLLMLLMTILSILAVEVVNPLCQELAKTGAWGDCERCPRAFASVFMANLTFFQTIVAGDEWGQFAVPLIEAYPWTGLLFAFALMVFTFGILNLIVAVVVEAYSRRRARDFRDLASQLDEDEVADRQELHTLFDAIDESGDGLVSYEELIEGAKKVAGFSQWLRVLDIDANDLELLFHMVDLDRSGVIDRTEFIETMFRFKNAETKTTSRFVKHMTSVTQEKLCNLEAQGTTMEKALQDLQVKVISTINRNLRSNMQGQEQLLHTGHEIQSRLKDQQGVMQEAVDHTRVIQLRLQQQAEAVGESLEVALRRVSAIAGEAARLTTPTLQDRVKSQMAERLPLPHHDTPPAAEAPLPRQWSTISDLAGRSLRAQCRGPASTGPHGAASSPVLHHAQPQWLTDVPHLGAESVAESLPEVPHTPPTLSLSEGIVRAEFFPEGAHTPPTRSIEGQSSCNRDVFSQGHV